MKSSIDIAVAPTINQLLTHSLSGVVQQEIERMILSGELPAGERLNESVLSRKLSVSRGPIREACRALAESGLVKLVPNLGAFVKGLDRADAMEVYDMRAGVTALAASLLAPIVTPSHIRGLQRIIDKMERAAEASDFAVFNLLNLEFHQFIIEAANNSRLVKIYDQLVKEFRLFRMHGLVQQSALMDSNREHRTIVATLEERDSRKSYDVSFEHVAKGKQRMMLALDTLDKEQQPPGD